MTGVLDPEAIEEDFVPRRRDALGAIEADGETLVVTDAGDVHRLNPTAAVVWSCCDGAGPLGELVDELAEAYQADRSVIAPDVLGIVREFGRSGLLEGVRPGADPDEDGTDGEADGGPAEGDGACPEPTATEPVESDVPLPRYLIVPPSS